MRVEPHKVNFRCKCGLEATILEVLTRADGTLYIQGVCAICGKDIYLEVTWASRMVSCAILDYLAHRAKTPEDMLEDFTPMGKPS